MKFILALCVPFSSFVYGEEGFDLQLGLGSIHAEKRADLKPWNEANPGMAVQYVTPGMLLGKEVEYCATAGVIRNSEFGQTVYAGGCVRKAILEGSVGKISVGAFAGGMTYPSRYNHQRKDGEVFPAVLPTISGCLKNGMCVDMMFIPKIQKEGSAAVLFAGRFPIKRW
ncbi:hypothetical protein EXS57_01825 [Candidatus Kaiserbacteria bacterium]|nr:hypothetical protein [Candidatus Kaiserbacteria bacterium]